MSVNLWRVYCITESQFVTGYLSDGQTCTVCFNNNTHTVNNDSINIVSTITQNTSLISTQTPGQTPGNFRAENNLITCAANSISYQTMSFSYNINILSLHLQISPNNVGDMFEIIVRPKSYIGTLASEVTSGSTVISLSEFIISLLSIGFQLVFTKPDFSLVEEEPEIQSIDTVNNTVTLVSGTTTTFPTGSYIKFMVKRIKTYYLNYEGHKNIGNYLRASLFPLTVESQLRYTNNTNTSKTFVYGIEYLY